MNITIAKNAGFCFGVKNAVKIAEKAAKKYKKVYTIGPLIHNPIEVERLKKLNIIPLETNNIEEGVVITRTHGVEKELLDKLKRNKKITIIDATCPFVKRAQRIAKKMTKQNYKLFIFGDKNHPEVKYILSYIKGKGTVINSERDIKDTSKVALISQTTQPFEKFINIKNNLMKKIRNLKVFNTICKTTIERQKEAKKLAKESDLVLVVGGKTSANTNRLLNVSRKYTEAYLIENKDEIKPFWLKGKKNVAIIGGASTPMYIINEVKEKCLMIS